MGQVAYVSEVRIERMGGPLRAAFLPGETAPVVYGMHGAVAEHYGVVPDASTAHATTLDHLVGAVAG